MNDATKTPTPAPELQKLLKALEELSARYDSLTMDLRHRVTQIHNPAIPEPDTLNKKEGDKLRSEDMVSCLWDQIENLSIYANRLDILRDKLDRII